MPFSLFVNFAPFCGYVMFGAKIRYFRQSTAILLFCPLPPSVFSLNGFSLTTWVVTAIVTKFVV